MEKRKRWQLAIILTVLAWTVYNILPTIIYYTRPLNQPIDEKGAEKIVESISQRVNSLSGDSEAWIASFCSMVGVHPSNIKVDTSNPAIITFDVASPQEVAIVQKFFPRAGMLIPFKPSQMFLDTVSDRSIRVNRQLSIEIPQTATHDYFTFIKKRDSTGAPTTQYFTIAGKRFVAVASAIGGPSPLSQTVTNALRGGDKQALEQIAIAIADWKATLTGQQQLIERLVKNLFEGDQASARLQALATMFRQEEGQLQAELDTTRAQHKDAVAQGKIVPAASLEKEQRLLSRIARYANAASWLHDKEPLVTTSLLPLTKEKITEWISNARATTHKSIYVLPFNGTNPLIKSIAIDWAQDQIILELYDDITTILQQTAPTPESTARLRDAVSKMVMNEIARISRLTDETFTGEGLSYYVNLSQSPSSNGIIALQLKAVASSM